MVRYAFGNYTSALLHTIRNARTLRVSKYSACAVTTLDGRCYPTRCMATRKRALPDASLRDGCSSHRLRARKETDTHYFYGANGCPLAILHETRAPLCGRELISKKGRELRTAWNDLCIVF